MFSNGDRQVVGVPLGEPRGGILEIVAPPACVVIGLEARSGDSFDGFRLVSLPLGLKEIDLEQVKFSEWAGGKGDGWGALIGSSADGIVGIHGRSGSMIDSLGIVERKPK